MAFANEVKLFGKWSYEDVEVRGVTATVVSCLRSRGELERNGARRVGLPFLRVCVEEGLPKPLSNPRRERGEAEP